MINRNTGGKPLRVIGPSTDTDLIKRDAQRIEHLRQRLELAIRGSRFGVWEFDLASNTLIWDEQMHAIYGHTPDTFDSSVERWQACLHPEYRAMVDDRFQELVDGIAVDLFEFTILRACDGAERRIEANGYLQRDANGHPQRLVGMNRDITDQWLALSERNRAEREILALNLDLERRVAERTSQLHASNQELQAFTYAVSHDLRAPLRGIDGWSQALVEDCEHLLDDIGRAHLQRIRGEVRRMSDLVSGLLRLSRVVQSDLILTTVDISVIAESILERLREEHRSRMAHTQVQPGIRVFADAPLMFLALANLLENAWKFTSLREVTEISLAAIEYPDRVVVSVNDNGVGFDMRHSAGLFQPFVRLHREADYSGTGLGLATVDRIMRRHGGAVSVSAVIGKGAAFQLTFPKTS